MVKMRLRMQIQTVMFHSKGRNELTQNHAMFRVVSLTQFAKHFDLEMIKLFVCVFLGPNSTLD